MSTPALVTSQADADFSAPSPSQPTRRLRVANLGAVYLLTHVDMCRFKLGVSVKPLHRVSELPEGHRGDCNLNSSHVAWFAPAARALNVEKSLHRCLAPYRVRPNHRGSGYTEWFGMHAMLLARRMLMLMPERAGSVHCARLVPLDHPPALHEGANPMQVSDDCALDTWWRIEDLWLRVALQLPMRVQHVNGERQLVCDCPASTILSCQRQLS